MVTIDTLEYVEFLYLYCNSFDDFILSHFSFNTIMHVNIGLRYLLFEILLEVTDSYMKVHSVINYLLQL